jgi:hypothetical protein
MTIELGMASNALSPGLAMTGSHVTLVLPRGMLLMAVVQAVFLAVKGEDYKPAVRFVIAAARKAGLHEEASQLWWDGMSKETMKARLHGLRLLGHFRRERYSE